MHLDPEIVQDGAKLGPSCPQDGTILPKDGNMLYRRGAKGCLGENGRGRGGIICLTRLMAPWGASRMVLYV